MKQVKIEIPTNKSGNFDLATQDELVQKHLVVDELKNKAKEYQKYIRDLAIVFDNQLEQSKEVLIKDLFNLPSIKGVTKNFIENNKGAIPVYGGRMFEDPVGYIAEDMSNVKYFENCLAWNRNGTTGYVFFHNHKFTTTDDHRPMILKDPFKGSIDLEYARIVIETILVSRYSWGDKAGKDKVEKISIRIPVLPNGDFDISAQKEISLMNSKIYEIKQSLMAELSKITTVILN